MLNNVFYLNEQGKRQKLEDSIFPAPGIASVNDRLFIVCDGVGGQSKGEEASRIACESIGAYIRPLAETDVGKSEIITAVNSAVIGMQQYAKEHLEDSGMSTTLTLAYIKAEGIWVAWCGDSRIYHISGGAVIWQSKDHSLVQQLVENGEISKDEAKIHPQRNIITRCLSASNSETKVDTHFIDNAGPGDYILLCTDGLLENIDEASLAEILGPRQHEPDKQRLFMDYCAGNTSDNYSMYLLQLGRSKNIRSGKKVKLFWMIFGLLILFVILLLLIKLSWC